MHHLQYFGVCSSLESLVRPAQACNSKFVLIILLAGGHGFWRNGGGGTGENNLWTPQLSSRQEGKELGGSVPSHREEERKICLGNTTLERTLSIEGTSSRAGCTVIAGGG